ncbi:MAG: MFS transporter [Eubacterium sp.]|nr:MFS transporter [Eubacterium sp.]
MADVNIKQKAQGLIDNVRYYWKEPPRGKYMSFKEVAAYAFGGIGAYFIIQLGSTLIVGTTNMIVGAAIGVAPTDMYIIYLIATFLNIPLTAVRANMVDNTRGKTGKYRPYLLSMGIPTALIALAYVWFPYERLSTIFSQPIFGKSGGYVATCAVVFVFNLLLHFFFFFFQDAYTNLIHVLSPNTQERTDVLAVKSVVYSFAPSVMNIVMPLVAKYFTNDNLYDIRVYRFSYPVFAIIGIALTIVVYANTKEKIVQAKTHTIQISFIDAFKEVAKNKYFWIIALAGWLGFLEYAYGNILQWSYSYGHTCSGEQLSLINTLIGNASLWGMLLAPICIRRFGKKKVLVAVNLLNVVCILFMLVNMRSIWWLFVCVYFNYLVGAFEQITTPAIQADIRDYQQYKTGERIDGMFATVATIGNLVTLITSAFLPAVQEHYGVYEGNGYAQPFDILDVTTGEPGLLYKMMGALIIMAAAGAFLNVVPYFFYDFTEKKQKSVIRVLQVRSLFEDYGNNALSNHQIVEAIDMVNNAREMASQAPRETSKAMYKNLSDKAERKLAKKQYKENLIFNEEIEISKFVCKELDKFNSELFKHQVAVNSEIYSKGLACIKDIDINSVKTELAEAKALPKNTEDEKEFRKFRKAFLKQNISAKRAYDKYYGTVNAFVEPDMAALTALFDKEDAIEAQIFELVEIQTIAKKNGDKDKVKEIKAQIKELQKSKKDVQKQSKVLMDEFAKFNRAAKPYNNAKKLLIQQENYSHFDEIAALYDEAKIKAEQEDKEREAAIAAKKAEEEAELAARKAKTK